MSGDRFDSKHTFMNVGGTHWNQEAVNAHSRTVGQSCHQGGDSETKENRIDEDRATSLPENLMPIQKALALAWAFVNHQMTTEKSNNKEQLGRLIGNIRIELDWYTVYWGAKSSACLHRRSQTPFLVLGKEKYPVEELVDGQMQSRSAARQSVNIFSGAPIVLPKG